MSQPKMLAEKDLFWAVAHRRHLHSYPELSYEEKLTSLYCRKVLEELGLDVKVLWMHGFIADLKSEGAKKTIAWRCELDALALSEKSDKDFASRNEGVAHMCGHDMHMAVSLLGAKILSENPSFLKNNVRFIFQPAEECPPGGALDMIASGCLDGVDEIYGLHNDPLSDTGMVSVRKGPITGRGRRFRLFLKGKGTHAAMPFLGLNPIIAASQLIIKWHEEVGKLKDLSHPSVFDVTKVSAGDTYNVIPEDIVIYGAIRSYEEKDLQKIEKILRDSFTFLEKEGFEIDFSVKSTYPATINSPLGVEKVISAARLVMAENMISEDFEPTLCGEDFSYFLQKRPGAFFFLGSRNKSKKIFEPYHSPRFDVDEDAIALGAAIMVELVHR